MEQKEDTDARQDDECSDDDEFDAGSDSGVQLGFIERVSNPLFTDKNWQNWDGGKIGGRPVSHFLTVSCN